MNYVTDSFDERVAEILQKGGVGLLPTDTIYGLSCRALDQKAVERIRRLKHRDSNKPFIVLVPSPKILNKLSISLSQLNVVSNYWPGALSVVFEAPAAPAWLLRGGQSLAVRVPNRPELLKLMGKTGPLISTSANIEGGQPARSVKEAQTIFGDKLDFYVDAGKLNNPPSTLVELKNGKLHVVRQGAVTIDKKEQK